MFNILLYCYCSCYWDEKVNAQPAEVSAIPFERVAIDLGQYRQKTFIVLVDYSTRWIVIQCKLLRSKKPTGVETFLNEVFSTHVLRSIKETLSKLSLSSPDKRLNALILDCLCALRNRVNADTKYLPFQLVLLLPSFSSQEQIHTIRQVVFVKQPQRNCKLLIVWSFRTTPLFPLTW